MLPQTQFLAAPSIDFSTLDLATAAGPVVPFGSLFTLTFIATLVVAILLERRRPFRGGQRQTVKRSYRFNLITFLLNDFALSLLSLPTLYVIAESFSGVGLLSHLDTGWAKFLVCFVLLDLTMYAWHYAMHHDDMLWVFHRVHHDDESVNVTTALRFHTGELVMETLVRVLFIIVVGADAGTVLACQAVVSLFVLMHHTNLKLPGERVLAHVFIVPRLHRVHHSVLRAEHDSNYGAVFSVWDRLFRTLKEQEPTAIGLMPNGQKGFLDLLQEGLHALHVYSHGYGHKPALVSAPAKRQGSRFHG
jgi:sterol desaturase/sphingolipid hydroxylase (fatty acid hydroxylase superfamily)